MDEPSIGRNRYLSEHDTLMIPVADTTNRLQHTIRT